MGASLLLCMWHLDSHRSSRAKSARALSEDFLPPALPLTPCLKLGLLFPAGGGRACGGWCLLPAVVLCLPDSLIRGTNGYLGSLQVSESSLAWLPRSQFQCVPFMVHETWPTNQAAGPLESNEVSPPQDGRLLLPLGTPRKKAVCWVSLQTTGNSGCLPQIPSGRTLHLKEDPQGVPCLLSPRWLTLRCIIKNLVEVWWRSRSSSISSLTNEPQF